MKRTSLYVLSLLMLTMAGCTDKFDAINTDPNQASESQWDPNFFLPNAQNNYANLGYDQMLYQGPMLQILASTFTYYGNGDKYVNTQNSTSALCERAPRPSRSPLRGSSAAIRRRL